MVRVPVPQRLPRLPLGRGTGQAPDIAARTAAERLELAKSSDALAPARRDAPGPCAGRRVREAVGHMSMGFRYPTAKTLVEPVRERGSVGRTTDRLARRYVAARPARDLVGSLRTHTHHPWEPPLGGPAAALGHDVVRGLDVTVALGVDRRIPRTGCGSSSARSTGAPSGSSAPTSPASGRARLPRPVLRHRRARTGVPSPCCSSHGRRPPSGRLRREEVHRFVTA
ncbi:hypothetical protein Shyhy01_56070 [Streptomyces hygroscopicus subsp. hygroscopicus]|nr:hypothetical protein Shyhy01_56070 [Streptomyces hygroscopicus subsp. hygroscopicus]